MAAGCRHLVYQLTPVYLPKSPAGVSAVSERPRCGPIGPFGYTWGGLRHIAALAIAHPQLGFVVGSEMARQLASVVRGSRDQELLEVASSRDLLCWLGGNVCDLKGSKCWVGLLKLLCPPGPTVGPRRAGLLLSASDDLLRPWTGVCPDVSGRPRS